MELVRLDPDDVTDGGSVDRYVAVENAVRAADSPWEHPLTRREARGQFVFGWDLEPSIPFIAVADGVDVGVGSYSVSDYDNRHLAWLTVHVHPDHRRQGHGAELLRGLVEQVRDVGRTSIGVSGWDADRTRGFADAHGLELKAVEVNRRQHLGEVDWADIERRYDQASVAAAAYELVRLEGDVPEEQLAQVAVMVSAINDAPTDDLDIEDEVFPPERIRAYETAQRERGQTMYRLIARHRETGELAGHTVVVVDRERPHLGEQHDTSVVASHRGHRLGLLLKSAMNLWLRESEPQLETIDTWNAESNPYMIGVNELLGYRIVGRELAFQKSV